MEEDVGNLASTQGLSNVRYSPSVCACPTH